MLIRIYSRSVSVFYILLACSATWMFGSILGTVQVLSMVIGLLLLCSCYQDQKSVGRTFYLYMLISIVSLLERQVKEDLVNRMTSVLPKYDPKKIIPA